MRYIVECRKKDEIGNIQVEQFRGFGDGLVDRKMADEVFNREVKSQKWGAVYMEKLYANGTLIDVKTWYK